MKLLPASLIGSLLFAPVGAAWAAEGMWTFDDVPVAQVERSVGVRLDRPWLDHLRLASVRLTTGCSAAMVSREGLALTNQHCVIACAEALSVPGRDYVRDGFYTEATREERACPGMQAEVLIGIVDATHAIFDASARKTGDDFVAAREGAIAAAERRVCRGDRRLRCQLISFYGGAEFKVYAYRKYDDVRLAFAPEFATAFFGGDQDNFSFPRYDLDCAFVRLYERGRPAATPVTLAWSKAPPGPGEAVFISGNPGATERGATVAQLESARDLALPTSERERAALRLRLLAFGSESGENRRLAANQVFEQENVLKVIRGRLASLNDPGFLAARRQAEADLRAAVAADPKLAAAVGDPWGEIARAQRTYDAQFLTWRSLEAGAGGGSQLYAWARSLVRAAAERSKPTALRLPEYADSRLALVEKSVLDPRPVAPDLDRLYLADWLTTAREDLGPTSPAAQALLGDAAPETIAATLVAGSRLADPAVRRALWNGGASAVAASADPMIAFVLRTDPLARAARGIWEDDVEGPIERAEARIAMARFAVRGADLYPDATFSLRFSWGAVAGWRAEGREIGPFTSFSGLYDRASAAEPLPSRWLAARGALDPATVLNFVATTDIIGGNSGSPVVNARGELVGTAFDGNQASIAGDFAYDGARNRTVVLSTAAITEALTKVYGQGRLLDEIAGR